MNWTKHLAAALGGLVLAACGGADAVETSTAPGGATPTSAVSPAAASRSSAATATASATAQPSPTPVPSPTTEPTKLAPTAASTQASQPATPVPPAPTPIPPTQAPPSAPLARSVGITEFNQFSPASVTLAAGGTVTWSWNSAQYHDVTGIDFTGSSAAAKSGSFSITFPTAGTYRYECQVHSYAGMTGTVIVQ